MNQDPVAGVGPDPTGAARRRAVIYTRTAAPESPGSHANHASQEARCRQEAERLGLDVVDIVHDVALPAGFDADKPGWRRVEALVRSRQVEVVLTSDFTRLTRSWADVGFLMSLGREFGVDFRTPADSPSDTAGAVERLARRYPPLDRRRPRPRPAHDHPRPTEGNH